jgi:hypothetical protein
VASVHRGGGAGTAASAATAAGTALSKLAAPLAGIAKNAPLIGTALSLGTGAISAYQGVKQVSKDVEEGKVTVTTVPDRFGGATIVFSDKNGNVIKEHKVQSPIMSPDAGGGANPPAAPPPGGPWKVVPTPVPGAK